VLAFIKRHTYVCGLHKLLFLSSVEGSKTFSDVGDFLDIVKFFDHFGHSETF
jgi:hypothetical protein